MMVYQCEYIHIPSSLCFYLPQKVSLLTGYDYDIMNEEWIHLRLKKEKRKMNETLKVLEERRSCRAFKSDMITEEELNSVIKAGTYAPSGMGRQSPIIIAITNKEVRDALAKENAKIGGWGEDFDPFYGAPVVLIVLADISISTYKEDGSLVIGNMLNAAESIGLGSIWIHRAKEEFEAEFGKNLLKKLGIEGDYEGIGHCALGYPAGEKSQPKPRKENYVYYVS